MLLPPTVPLSGPRTPRAGTAGCAPNASFCPESHVLGRPRPARLLRQGAETAGGAPWWSLDTPATWGPGDT